MGFEEGETAPFRDVGRHTWLVGASKEGRERLCCTLSELSVLVKSGSRQTLRKRISDFLRTCAFDEFH
jgi:hypothetical protein